MAKENIPTSLRRETDGIGALLTRLNAIIDDVEALAAAPPSSEIETAIIQRGDYSDDTPPIATPLFPWSDPPVKLADPDPGNATQMPGVSWSPGGEFFATVNNTTPSAHIYQRFGTSLVKLADPAVLPVTPARLAWSLDGEFLAYGGSSAPRFIVYQRSGSVFTKLADPASLPASSVKDVHWSSDGRFVVVAHSGTPFILVYERTGLTTFTKLADPVAPPPDALDATWSPDGRFLAVCHSTGLTLYSRSGTALTKLADPDVQPGDTRRVNWSPNGKFLVAAASTSPFVFIYSFDGTSTTKLVDPASLPAGSVLDAEWSPDQQFLGMGVVNAAAISLYQTTQGMPASGILKVVGVSRAGT